MARRGLQALVMVLATVAVVAGAVTVLTGGAFVLEAGGVSPSVDSELRFYAAWYVGLGVLLFWTVPRIERAGITIRTVCAVLLLAATGRVISLSVVGPPHPLYVALMVLELVVPIVLVPWQTAIARQAARTT